MSQFKFPCPQCEQKLQCEESFGGRQIQCPSCKHLITIPLSPSQLAAGQKPQSGHTWDTIMPQSQKPKPSDPGSKP